jgi:hypothetical protein
MNWSPDEMEKLERAIVEGARIQLSRRGTEYVVIPRTIRPDEGGEVLVATTNTGDDLRFALGEIERFDVLW